jgi:hypothetical protein
MADRPTPDEIKKRHEESRRNAIESFPFPRIECAGDQALAAWQNFVTSGRGAPVVVGDYDALARIAQMPDQPWLKRKSTQEVLELAGRIRHPDDMIVERTIELAKARERLQQRRGDRPEMQLPDFVQAVIPDISLNAESPEELIARMLTEFEPEVGEWPTTVPEIPHLSVAVDLRSGAPMARVYLVTIPTNDWTTIPAYLRFGNWNSCPAPEYHVAALRSWRDRFGAELIGLGHDVMNIRVKRRPTSRAEALELAREQYSYCSDIVEQGVGSLSALAAALMESDWWYFWWD